MNLLVTAQETLTVPDLNGRLGITLVMLLIALFGATALLGRDNIFLKLLGTVLAAGSTWIIAAQWTVDSGLRLLFSWGVIAFLSSAQVTQGGAKTTSQKVVFIILAVMAVVGVLLQLAGFAGVSVDDILDGLGSAWDVLRDAIVSGIQSLSELFETADDAVTP